VTESLLFVFDRTQEFLKQCLVQWNDSVFGSWNTHSQRQYTPQHYTYTTTTTSTVTVNPRVLEILHMDDVLLLKRCLMALQYGCAKHRHALLHCTLTAYTLNLTQKSYCYAYARALVHLSYNAFPYTCSYSTIAYSTIDAQCTVMPHVVAVRSGCCSDASRELVRTSSG
jgi:hypothetical protein